MSEEIKIDDNKVKCMIRRIIQLESKDIKKVKKDPKIIESIKDIIKEEIKCKSNL